MTNDPDFEGLLPWKERQHQWLEERAQLLTEILEEARVSIGGERGDLKVAILYEELHLPDPGPSTGETQ